MLANDYIDKKDYPLVRIAYPKTEKKLPKFIYYNVLYNLMYNFIEKETLMQPFVKLTEVIKEFNLKIEYAPDGYELYKIFQEGVNRAALQLTGFFDNFDSGRVQLIGGVEHIFLEKMTSEQRTKAFDDLFAFGIPIIIFAPEITAR